MKKTTFKNRIINPEDFIGKRFKPSIQTKSNFIKLFEMVYPKFSEEINIKSLEWTREKFSLMLLEKSSGEVMYFDIKDNFGSKKCAGILCTPNICTGVHSEVQNEVFLKFLVNFLVKANSFTLDTFLKVLTKDLKAKKEYYQIFWKQNRPPFSVIQDWGHPLQKYRFIVHEGVMRNMDQSIRLNLAEASIHHSERECQGISPNNKDTGYHFFNFPGGFYNHNFDKYYYLTKEEKEKYLYGENEGQNMGITTDLDENDIVMGEGTDKLTRALEYIEKNIEKNNIKMVNFNCCCVPRIIGDDIYSVLKRTKEKIKVPFIFQGQLEKTPYEQKVLLLEDYIEKIDTEKIKKSKNSISLFGYHENIFQKSLGDILHENNVKINTSFIPTIDVRLLELMYKSELFIFSPNNFQKEVFEYPFQEIGTKFISPKYPYGALNTDNWLKNILKEFNLNLKIPKKEQKIKDEYFEDIKLVEKKGYRVGVVFLGIQEIKKFFNTDYMNNIDIVEFLEEMGFKLEFFVFDDFTGFTRGNDDSFKLSDGNHEKIEELIYSRVKKKDKLKITYFSKDTKLDSLLGKKKLDLIYSDLYFDDRITALGINQINLKNFHIGYAGALKTIKGLINLCEMNFYKKYSKYFTN